MDPAHVILIGGGDRLDHSLAAIGALGAASLTSIPTIDAWWGAQHLPSCTVPGKVTLALVPGSTVSLLAIHGPCSKVSIHGTRWELDQVDFEPMIGTGSATRCSTTRRSRCRSAVGVLEDLHGRRS